jgi:monoamine oxidase
VHLHTPVREIAQSERGVAVVADAIEVEAQRVIVAIPPALAARIAYTPALPLDRAQLMERAPAGSAIKYVAVYENAFWRSDGASGQTVALGSTIEMTLDAGPPSGSPGVLAAFAFGPHGREMSVLAPEVRRKIVLETMTNSFGPRAATPVEFYERDWAAEAWSRGCFMAHFAPGVLTQYGHALRTPCGRIHWAGTETSTLSHGTIDGALRSGVRAAGEVIQAG